MIYFEWFVFTLGEHMTRLFLLLLYLAIMAWPAHVLLNLALDIAHRAAL